MNTLRSRIRTILPERIGWEPYVHLVWLIFLGFQPIFDPTATVLDWALIGVIVAAFLPVYLWCWVQDRPSGVLRGVLAMAALGIFFVPFNSGASSFFIYAAAAAAFAGPPRVAGKLIAGLVALTVIIALLFGYFVDPYILLFFLPVVLMTAIIGATNIYHAEKARADTKLRMAHDEVERLAKIAERERIARDLHDLLGHTLSVITLKSELAAKLAERDPGKAAGEMREVEKISRQALAEVRAAVRGYRSQGLPAELANAKLALESAAIELDMHVEPLELSPTQEGVLALALREAVTNVLRHAHASRCTVRLSEADGWARLEIEDDGKGGRAPEGSGLQGMRDRVEAQGGRLERDGSAGTRLTVWLPARATASAMPELKLAEAEPSA